LQQKDAAMSRGDVSEESNAPQASREVEKLPAHVTNGHCGDQISSEMLKELAPNGEEEYILDKINNMAEDEAIAIVKESRESNIQNMTASNVQSAVSRGRLELSFRNEESHAAAHGWPQALWRVL
jgi:hypothetical protein